ncbi:MAG: rod shape-determining protein MreC [Bacteroidales bacterium]|nr:rod shape-determining protein MreC [Bacteroidales bacterium]
MTGRPALVRNAVTVLVFIALEVLCLVMIANNSVVQRYRILGGIREAQASLWQKTSDIRYYFSLKKDNLALVQENEDLRHQLSLYEARAAQETEPDSVFDHLPGIYSYKSADIVKSTRGKQHNYLLIDKGSRAGIEEGMGVVTANGVVGIIDAVSDNYSYVISFLNTEQSISARLTKSDHFGLLRWEGVNPHKATLTEISLYCGAAIGDSVATSGHSSIFPPDIPVGVISKIKPVSGMYLNLEIDLFQDFTSLRHVYVVANNDREEIEELEKEEKDER